MWKNNPRKAGAARSLKERYIPHTFLYAALSFAFIACYSLGEPKTQAHLEPRAAVNTPAPPDKWQLVTSPRFAALPAAVTPGEYTAIVYLEKAGAAPASPKLRANLYNAQGKRIAGALFFDFPLDDAGHGVKAALLVPPSTSLPGAATVKIEDGQTTLAEIPFEILNRRFTAEVIPLNPVNTGLRTEPDPRKTAESERLWAILNTTGADVWAAESFITPVPAETRRSSFFGDRRVYQYSNGKSDTSVHAGIDYAVPKGTGVKACAGGKVVLAQARIVTGNSVIIEHLPGVYSLYYHLDEILTQEGAAVQAGALIGRSGSTGLSTGPHLHWEIRVSTENADPDSFTARPPLGREAVLAALFPGSSSE